MVRGINFHNMNIQSWLINKKIPILVTFIGAITGFLYWYFIGCESGSCAITSVWYRTMIYGAIMGWLLGDIINDKLIKPKG